MNKTFKYIVLLALACFVGKANAQELKTEVFSLLNLDYPGLEKVKALHQEGKDADAAKALLDYQREDSRHKPEKGYHRQGRTENGRRGSATYILCPQRLPAVIQLR